MSEHTRNDANYSVPRECAGLRTDQALALMFPQFSRNRLSAWLREGRVRIGGATVKPNHKVWGGEAVELDSGPEPRDAPPAAEAIELRLVHEDPSVLVVDKPAGLVVHPGSGNWSGTMLNALLHHDPALEHVPRAGIVHRLDKDTSGLLVVARSVEAQVALVRQMQARSVERIYLAVAHGVVAREGSVEKPIGRDPRQRTRMAVVAGGRPALTHYQPVESFEGASLLECSLATGRTHQIRVHLHSIGHALVGDPVYRSTRASDPVLAGFPRQALHAARLSFDHPAGGRRRTFRSALPRDMRDLVSALRKRGRGKR
jgi:23S rRNA pseudouridine1911/1915/1917 synthase